jgi:cytochrome c-type biogenesis protein CcmH/NrfG
MSRDVRQNGAENTWTSRETYLLAMVTLFCGLIVGYLFHGTTATNTTVAAPVPSAAAPAAAQAESPEQVRILVQPMLDAARVNPKDPEPLIQAGNTYYDHRFYPEAIQYYEKALALRPNDVNVRTDMATALFYSGNPQRAVEEFKASLKVDPNHAQTLFNMGIVKYEGLKDSSGAIAAWERLLATNPNYPDKQKVQTLIEKAKRGES